MQADDTCRMVHVGYVQHSAVKRCTQRSAVHCSAVQCSAVQHRALQCAAVHCSALQSKVGRLTGGQVAARVRVRLLVLVGVLGVWAEEFT
jgi:hypothetical protein